ncbi:MAG: hypothetical protein JST84_12020 [Acidobacteria bacterium]|nr:hypothetical protein [Acidobacteriota bacterium]
MKSFLAAVLALSFLLILSISAQAQWQDGNLAIKTNGSIFKSGEPLKVEVIALESIPESFSLQVSYSYTIKVKKIEVKEDADGKKTETENEVDEMVTRRRERGSIILNMEQYQTQLLDDTYHFGEGAPRGCLTVNVDVFRAYSKERVSTLSSSVCYEESDRPTTTPFLRGFKKVYSDTWISFDGLFSPESRYSALLISDGKVVQHLRTGIHTNDRKELNLSSFEFNTNTGKNYEVLVSDHNKSISSTLSKVTIPLSK